MLRPPRANGAPRTTRPGSTGHAIAETARATSAAAGAPLTLESHRTAFAAAHDAIPITYAAQFFSLVDRGVLVALAGRSSQTRYAHRDQAGTLRTDIDVPGEGAATDDDGERVLQALGHAFHMNGGPVTTMQITTALAALGHSLASTDINAVRVRLRTLARERVGGLEEWRAPRVVLHETRSAGGRIVCLWSPAGQPVVETVGTGGVYGAADAVRALVRHVQDLLGRPVERRELLWWLDLSPEHEIARAVETHISSRDRSVGDLLQFTLGFDKKREVGRGTLQRVGGTFACWGGVAARYWMGPLVGVPLVADRLAEAGIALRARDEVTAIAQLEQRAGRSGGSALRELIAIRTALLARVRAEVIGDASAEEVATAAGVLAESFARAESWAVATAPGKDSRHERKTLLRERASHVAAFAQAPRSDLFAGRSVDVSTLAVMGDAAVVTAHDLDPFITAMAKELDVPAMHARRTALKGVRRLPKKSTGVFGNPHERDDVGVDRVDAVAHMYRMAPVAWANTMIAAAVTLLGPVLRDAGVMRGIATDAGVAPDVRRAAVVALGMLGGAPGSGLMNGTGDARRDAKVRMLATVLAGAKVDEADYTDPQLKRAVRRIHTGRLLTALG